MHRVHKHLVGHVKLIELAVLAIVARGVPLQQAANLLVGQALRDARSHEHLAEVDEPAGGGEGHCLVGHARRLRQAKETHVAVIAQVSVRDELAVELHADLVLNNARPGQFHPFALAMVVLLPHFVGDQTDDMRLLSHVTFSTGGRVATAPPCSPL